jgi:hypothetical protein
MLTFYPSRIPDPGVKKAPNPGSGSETLIKIQALNCVAVSDCESTDSSDSSRKGKQKLGAKVDHLLDMQHRVSPRCHASTKVITSCITGVAYR